ncbi:MAG TPA: helix-turn-helix domain-containing protein [Bryobacteraceae bacterium]|jgi:DNA-binding NtrC family response regulator|nr:helix-turn-helix domain-containing protein [Bryobacteraceae bacterium]
MMKQELDVLVGHLLDGTIFLEQAIELLEQRMIEGALAKTGGKQTAASKLLGIHRNTLQRKMVQYGVGNSRPRRKPVTRATRARKRKPRVA